MAAKAEAAPAAAAPAKDGAAAPAAPGAAAPAKGGIGGWIPVIAVVVLAPALTFAAVEFVLVPRLQTKLAIAASGELPPPEHAAEESSGGGHGGGGHGKEGKEGKEGGSPNFEFKDLVVNLAGTMGTRYLKTTFIVTGPSGAATKPVFEGAKDQLKDVTISVLSSLTLSDLEEPGAKNVIREKLVNAYNQALTKKVAEQVYFSEFVVQ